MKEFRHVVYDADRALLKVIDQRYLPTRMKWFTIRDADTAYRAIKGMIVRGAPLIGVTGAFGFAFEVKLRDTRGEDVDADGIASYIASARPTAVNLSNSISRALSAYMEGGWRGALHEAVRIMKYEEESSYRIGVYGSELLEDGDVVLTHCNAGSLATVRYGTALAPVRVAIERGKLIRVMATETRPVLQGARLTTFELVKDGIDTTLISDTMVGYVMYKGLVDKVIVGADRVLIDGHVFNKIGTYQVAILARKHDIPFYVALPISTLDLKSAVEDVIIEERDPNEVLYVRGRRIAAKGIHVLNPAFDVTPPEYITALITDKGIIRPPFREILPNLVGNV